MLDVFGLFSVPTLYVLIGISVLLIVAIILSIVAIAKSSAMKKKRNILTDCVTIISRKETGSWKHFYKEH